MCRKICEEETVGRKSCRLEDNIKRNLQDRNVGKNKAAQETYYIRNQQDATLAVSFISHCKITLHVSDAFCVHNQE